MNALKITNLDLKDSFCKDYKKAKPDIRTAANAALNRLQANPLSTVLRLHSLNGYNPTVYTIDIFENKSWKISFSVEGETATIRRLAPHNKIDDNA